MLRAKKTLSRKFVCKKRKSANEEEISSQIRRKVIIPKAYPNRLHQYNWNRWICRKI